MKTNWNEKAMPGKLYGCLAETGSGAVFYVVAFAEPGTAQAGYIAYGADRRETKHGWFDTGRPARNMDAAELLLDAARAADPDVVALKPLPDGITPYSLRKDQAVYKIMDSDGKTTYLAAQWSDNEAASENCDACVAYWVFDADMRTEKDGGEMDYNSADKRYIVVSDAIADLMEFAYGPGADISGGWTAEHMPNLSLEDLGA